MPSKLPRFDGIFRPAKQLVLREWRSHPLRYAILLVAFIVAATAGGYNLVRQPGLTQASSHKFMAFWDGTTPPSGWICVSCTGGDDFFQVFPRGAATAGGTGGAATHDHSQAFVSHTAASTTTTNRAGQTSFTTETHTHGYTGDLSGRTATATSLPVYQNLKVIRYDTVGNPPDIPDGVIVLFDADPGSGWTRYSAQDGDMIRGENDATGTGGAATHTHTFSGTLMATADTSGRTGSSTTAATDTHTHTVSGTTASSDHTPIYRDVLLYKNTSGSAKALAGGEIFMSTGAPGSGWTELSGSGGAFENRFLRGAATYGGTGGAANHTPANDTNTSGTPSATAATSTGNPPSSFGGSAHTHSVTNSFGSGDNLPPYRDTIIAKKNTPAFTVEGTVFMANESTLGTSGNGGPCDDSTIVSVRVDGGAESTGTCSSGDATFSVSISPAPSAGNTIAVYLTSSIKANTIYLSDGDPDTGINLYESRVALGHLNAGPIGIADIDAYDSDQNNTDMLFDAEDTTTDTLDVEAGNELHIRTSETFTPVGNVTTPKMHVRGIYTGASETLILNGSGTGTARPLYVDGGTFTASSNTTTFTGTSATDIGALTFNNLNIHPASGTQTYTLLSGTLTVNGNLSVNNGATLTVDLNTNDPAIVAKGNVTLNALTTWTASTTASFTFQPSGTKTWTDSVATKQNLGLVSISGGASTPEIQLGTAVKATDITIAASHELDVVSGSNFALEVTGNWSNSGVFAAQNGIVTFSATDTGNTLSGTMTGSSAFYDLVFNGSGGEWTPSAAVAVTNDLTMTAGSLLGTQNVTVNGSVAGTAGIINLTGGTFEQRVAAAENFGTTSGSAAWTFSSLTFSSSAGSSNTITTQTGGSGGITVSSVMIVGKASDVDRTILAAGNRTWTLSGTGGNPLQTDVDGNGSRITGNTSTFAWTGDNGGGNTTIDQNASGTYNSLTFNNGTETFVLEGNTTTQNGGNITITAGTLDVTGSNFSLTIGGSYSNSGTFTAQGGTVTFNSTATGRTLAGTLNGGSAFNNLIFNGVGGEWSVNATMLVSNDMTVTNGNVIGASDIQVNGGDIICGASCGTIAFTGGTFTLNGTGNFGTTALASNWTFNNLTIGTAAINTTTAQGTGTITISGVLAFDSSNTFNAGAKTYVLAGTNGTPFTNAGSIFNANTSTFRYTGNNGGGDTNIHNDTYWNLEVNNGSEIYVLTGAQGVDNDLTITAGTLDVTATPHALTISGNYSNSGNFDSRTGTVTFDATDSGNTLSGQMTGTSDDFHNLIFNGVSGAWAFNAAVDISNDFTVTNGAVTANNNALNVTRDYTLANTTGVSYTAGSSTLTISRHFNDTGNKFVRGTSTVILNGTGNVNTTGNFNNLSYAFTSQVSTLNTSNFAVHGQMTFNGGTANATGGGYIGLERSSSGTPIVFAAATTISGSKSLYHSNNANSLTTTIAAGNYGSWNVITFTTGAHTSSTYQLAGNITTTGYVTLQAHNSSTGNVWNTQDFDVTALRFDLGSESRVGPWTVNFGAADFDLTDTGSSFGVVNNGGTHTFNLSTANIITDGDIRFVQGTGTISASGTTSTITMTPAAAATRTFYTNAQTIDNFVVNGGAGSIVLLNGDLIPSDNLTITAGTLDVSASNYIVTIGGNYSNSGTFDARASTVVFNATDTGNTMAGTMTGSSAFFALTFNGSGGEWTPSAAITVEQHLTMTAGTLLGSQNITVNQNVQGTNGIINLSGGTFEQRSNDTSRDFGTTSGSAAWTFNDLTFSDSCGVCVPGNITFTTQTGGSGGINVGGILRVGLAADPDNVTLNAGNRTWTLSGTGGDPFQLDTGSNLAQSTSTFTYSGNNGSGDTTIQTETYHILTVNNGSETYNLEGATVAVDITVSAGILALNSQTLQATGDLTVNGTLSGTTNVTVGNDATGTGTITLTGGTFSITDSAGGNFGTTSGTNNWTFNDLTFKENGDFSGMTVTTQTGGSGTITVSGILTVGNATDGTGTTLDAGNRTWTLSGTGGDPFQLVGIAPNLTPATSTFAYTGNNGSGDTTVQSETYNILQVNNGSEVFNLEGATSSLDTTVSAGTLALNGQTLGATNDLTVNGTLSGSTNVTVNGSVTGSGTVTLSGGTFLQRITANANETFGSTSGTNNWTFSTLFFRNSDGNNHSITFNPTGSGQIIVSAALTIGSGVDINTLTLDNDTNDRILDVNGSVTIGSTSIFEPSGSASFTVGDDWTNSGTFNHNNGTVTFDTTTTATIAGATTFYGFRSVTAAKTIQFTAGQTFTIDTGGLLTLTGAADPNEIQIQSTTASQWFINHQGTESVSFVQVINSGCDVSSTDISTTDSVDDGNNGTCWLFGSNFAQGSYRFGQPNGLDIDYTGAPAENAAYTTSGTSDDFRLRMLINVSGSNLAQNGNDFTLQFGEKTGAACTSGVSWADVETASGVIRYFDGGGRADGDNLTGNVGDPDDGNTVVDQDYEEANDFTNSVAAINSGQDGLWDFSLINHSAVGGKRYCFKVIDATGGGGDLAAYNQYPEVIVDEELIFTLDATSKDFGIIQPGGNPTDVSSTLTATTNSSTGYVVYAWSTQLMTMGAFTISDWTGTNASPTTFGNGSFGFGYTTDDASLTGGTADRFTNGGAKYAGFTHSGPGDPVADRTSGPVSSQQNTIGYRIAASGNQAAGDYDTTIVYVCSVTF